MEGHADEIGAGFDHGVDEAERTGWKIWTQNEGNRTGVIILMWVIWFDKFVLII
jgi:hypothetical protein